MREHGEGNDKNKNKSTGACAPEQIIINDDLSKFTVMNGYHRNGIRERRISGREH